MRLSPFALFACLAAASESELRGANDESNHGDRNLLLFRRFLPQTFSVTVTNLSYLQPLGPWFVMTGNDDADLVFQVGGEAGPALATLAEEGNPGELVSLFDGASGVGSAVAETVDVPEGSPPLLFPGDSLTFEVTTTAQFPLVSIASMAVNTNDCFVGFNRMRLFDGQVITTPGYDSGTEANNELCVNVPGPACSDVTDTGPAGGG